MKIRKPVLLPWYVPVGVFLLTALCSLAWPQAPAAPPALTKQEQSDLKVIELQFELLASQQQQLKAEQEQFQAQYSEFVKSLETEHPGFKWNPQAHQLMPAPRVQPAPQQKKAGN